MPVQTFNPLDSPTGAVSQTGSTSPASPPAVSARATGTPPIVKADGTGNLRVTTVTHRAEGNSTPGSSSAKWKPPKVQSFNGGSV